MRSLLPALGRRSPRRRWNPVPPGSRRPCWNLLRRSAIPWRCANQSGRPGRRGAPPPRRGVLGPRSRRRRLSGRPSGLANRSRALCQLVRRPNASGALSPSRHRPSAGGALSRSPRRRGSRSAIRVLFPLFRRLSAGRALLRLLLRPGRRGGRPPRRGVRSRLRRPRLSGCPSGGRSRGAGSALPRPPRRSSSGSRVLAPLRRRPSAGRSGNRALPPSSRPPSAGSAPSPLPRPPPAGAPLGPGPRPPPNRNPFPPPGGLPHLDRSAPGPRASSKASPCRGWWPGQGRGRPPRGRRHRKGAP